MKLSAFLRSSVMTFFILITSFGVQAQTTAFNYQGRLTDASMPAGNGTYDFEFALYDADGTLVASNSTATTGITVTNGNFAIKLDFGSSAFNGADRYLEIRVKKPNDSNYTPLSPRQQINSSPYAIRALSSGTADIAANATNATNSNNADTLDNIDSSNFVQTNSNQFIHNQTTPQTSADFNISGTGKANIFDVTTGYNIGGNRVFSVFGTGDLHIGIGAGASASTNAGSTFVGTLAGNSNTTGSQNAFFGYRAGRANTTGGANAFFGNLAGVSNTTGGYNSFFGYNTGFSNTTGEVNSFFGHAAGFNNTSGFRNSFFGVQAGTNNTIGNFNSFFGGWAGYSNSGEHSSFMGDNAGRNNTSGSRNSFFGKDAGLSNTMGSDNTIIGYSANFGAANLSFASALGSRAVVNTSDTIVLGKVAGTYNGIARPADTVQIPGNLTVAGTLSANINGSSITNLNASNITTGTLDNARLGIVPTANGGTGSATQNFVDLTTNQTIAGDKTFSNTLSGNAVNSATQYNIGSNRVLSVSGSNFLFVGIGAGGASNTGGSNSFVGYNAGNKNTTGFTNSFFGSYAGSNNTTGNINSFFGASAGSSNTTGSSNSFFGYGAGASASLASDNSFFGTSTGFSTTIGGRNSFFGSRAGILNSSGGRNSFFGADAGYSNTEGSGNVFFGDNAGLYNKTGSGNSFVGGNAGAYNEGSGNTFLGWGAGRDNKLGNNNTLIGYNVKAASDNLTYATAIGAEAIVSSSNTIVLGRITGFDKVLAPGLLQLDKLGVAGSTHLCRNANNEISTCTAQATLAENNVNDVNATTINSLREQVKQQQQQIDALIKLVCSQNTKAEVCKQEK